MSADHPCHTPFPGSSSASFREKHALLAHGPFDHGVVLSPGFQIHYRRDVVAGLAERTHDGEVAALVGKKAHQPPDWPTGTFSSCASACAA